MAFQFGRLDVAFACDSVDGARHRLGRCSRLDLCVMTKASELRSEFGIFRKYEAGFSVRTRQDFEDHDGSHADERITMPGKCYYQPSVLYKAR